VIFEGPVYPNEASASVRASAARSQPGGTAGAGDKDAPSKLAAMSAPCVRHGRANSPRDPPADAPWIMRLINRSCLIFKANLLALLA
jgi:hypothetical protein